MYNGRGSKTIISFAPRADLIRFSGFFFFSRLRLETFAKSVERQCKDRGIERRCQDCANSRGKLCRFFFRPPLRKPLFPFAIRYITFFSALSPTDPSQDRPGVELLSGGKKLQRDLPNQGLQPVGLHQSENRDGGAQNQRFSGKRQRRYSPYSLGPCSTK